ncbi:hypothetical protein O181_003979 [Austropuccinia psidii MF-1]|uniref:ATP-dependent DNA helicase n=1 Tax=Austropuccinia psidii MF-1 TaxID=1389203 RepID=A0A9Q3BF02_9BASI|nr:hypothetical protein [Austropuccinia psidii MF-1]
MQVLMFIDGLGGSGKTYLLNTIIQQWKERNSTVVAACSSGIAAFLLIGGRTAHSKFGIPLRPTPDSTCSWLPTDPKGKFLYSINLIIWDEITFQNRYSVEAVERSLRDLKQVERPFGGISVIFAGHFRQILPVVKGGSIYDQASLSIKKSALCNLLDKKELDINLRICTDSPDGEINKGYSQWILHVGNGTWQENDVGQIELDGIDHLFNPSRDYAVKQVMAFVYKDLQARINLKSVGELCSYFEGRGIVSPLNVDIHTINQTLPDLIPGRKNQSKSMDHMEEGPLSLSEEVLNGINPPGFPPHILQLKNKIPVILLQNLNTSKGLVNGTRLLVCKISKHALSCKIMTGTRRGQDVGITKIKLTYEDDEKLGITFTRYQLPITLPLVITINKSQGQSFDTVGVYSETSVFSHGQLYVALSRSRNVPGIFLGGVGPSSQRDTTNIVCRNILV